MTLTRPMTETRHSTLKRTVLGLAALALLANALYMLADPLGWYGAVEGVPDTGPFNPHFVRDIGVSYLSIALMTAAGTLWLRAAFPLLAAVTLYLGLHALLHLWDVAAGRLDVHHLVIDAPGVFLPAIVAALLTYWLRAEYA